MMVLADLLHLGLNLLERLALMNLGEHAVSRVSAVLRCLHGLAYNAHVREALRKHFLGREQRRRLRQVDAGRNLDLVRAE